MYKEQHKEQCRCCARREVRSTEQDTSLGRASPGPAINWSILRKKQRGGAKGLKGWMQVWVCRCADEEMKAWSRHLEQICPTHEDSHR